jgi:hypothetical protein
LVTEVKCSPDNSAYIGIESTFSACSNLLELVSYPLMYRTHEGSVPSDSLPFTAYSPDTLNCSTTPCPIPAFSLSHICTFIKLSVQEHERDLRSAVDGVEHFGFAVRHHGHSTNINAYGPSAALQDDVKPNKAAVRI